jgi:hypothetical protein
VLSFERSKWGGVRTDHVEYIAFDLEQFARAPRLQPTPADISLSLVERRKGLSGRAACGVADLKAISDWIGTRLGPWTGLATHLSWIESQGPRISSATAQRLTDEARRHSAISMAWTPQPSPTVSA